MTTENKTYSSKSTALRGAARAGIKNPVATQREDGRWELSALSPLYHSELRVKSEVKSPVKMVWDICFENKSAKRKDIVTKCIEAGVSLNTARTQYQRWREAEGLVRSPKLA